MAKKPAEHVSNSRPEPLKTEDFLELDNIEFVSKLLTIACERLEAGRKLETDRSIVYPECSVILHDCERLKRRLDELQGRRDQLEELLATLPKLLCSSCRKLLK